MSEWNSVDIYSKNRDKIYRMIWNRNTHKTHMINLHDTSLCVCDRRVYASKLECKGVPFVKLIAIILQKVVQIHK